MSEVAASAGHAAKAVGHEAVDVVVEYLLPLAGGVAGLATGPAALGGAYSLSNAINSATNANADAQATRIGGLIFAGIWGTVGYAFWHMRRRGGWIMMAIGGALGGYFFGTALGLMFFSVIPNTPAPSGGLVDQLFTWTANVAGGKA